MTFDTDAKPLTETHGRNTEKYITQKVIEIINQIVLINILLLWSLSS